MNFSRMELTFARFELFFSLPPSPEHNEKIVIDEPPPFLQTWPRVYIFVLCYLVVVIAVLYGFSLAYAP